MQLEALDQLAVEPELDRASVAERVEIGGRAVRGFWRIFRAGG